MIDFKEIRGGGGMELVKGGGGGVQVRICRPIVIQLSNKSEKIIMNRMKPGRYLHQQERFQPQAQVHRAWSNMYLAWRTS